MTQPEVGGTDTARAVMIFGSDGSKWIAALIDALGHLQVDVLTCPLPSDPATQTTLAAILAQLDVDLSTRAKESGGNLAAILAQLDVDLSTRAKESGGNLAAINSALDVALSTRAKESGGNLASILARIVEAPPVPTLPVLALGGFITVGSGSWVEIVSYSVTGGKTFYLTDFYATEHEITAGIQYLVDLLEGANVKMNVRGSGMASCKEHLTSPIKFTSGQAVKLNVYQWSGANKQFRGMLIGYEV